jgi:CheY-like chemotaxis protein
VTRALIPLTPARSQSPGRELAFTMRDHNQNAPTRFSIELRERLAGRLIYGRHNQWMRLISNRVGEGGASFGGVPFRRSQDTSRRPAVTHILVIDDNRAVSSALGIMFAHEELDVSIAHDGPTGIAAFGSTAFDLIMVDMFMPGLDGAEIIKTIRSLNSTIPIIAMTGFVGRTLASGEDNVLARAIELGATCTLEKPLNRPETMRAVISCLGLSSCNARGRQGDETVASP